MRVGQICSRKDDEWSEKGQGTYNYQPVPRLSFGAACKVGMRVVVLPKTLQGFCDKAYIPWTGKEVIIGFVVLYLLVLYWLAVYRA